MAQRQLVLVLAALCAACNRDLTEPIDTAYTITSIDVDSSLEADAARTTMVSVQVTPKPDFEPRMVKLETTIGLFENGTQTTGQRSIDVPVDTAGIARAFLRHSATPGIGTITASAGRGSVQKTIRFTYNAQSEFTEFRLARETAPADNTTIVEVLATVAPAERGMLSQVTFSTTSGSFVANNATTNSVIARVDESGTARAFLKTAGTAGLGLVSVTGARSTRQQSIQFFAPAMTLELPAGVLPADGASIVLVRARVTGVAPGAKVLFNSTESQLIPSAQATPTIAEQQVGADGTAVIGLKAPTNPGSVLITASIGGTVVNGAVQFGEALPDIITLLADRLTVSANSTIAITATLGRRVGTPTPGATVHFQALTPQGTEIPLITRSAAADAQRQARAQFTPANTTYRGPVIIRATTNGPAGPISAELIVEVTQ